MSDLIPTRPGRETPTSKSACMSWCEAQDNSNHWDYPGKLWQTIHEKHFGPFVVYIPEERHDDGENWVGQCEVHTDENNTVVYYADAAAELSEQLRAAVRFATDRDQQIADYARQGQLSTTPELLTRWEHSPIRFHVPDGWPAKPETTH